jgi:hypothetical protein
MGSRTCGWAISPPVGIFGGKPLPARKGRRINRPSRFVLCHLACSYWPSGRCPRALCFPPTKTARSWRVAQRRWMAAWRRANPTPMPEAWVRAWRTTAQEGIAWLANGKGSPWKRGRVSLLGVELGAGLVRLPPPPSKPQPWARGRTNQPSGLLPASQPHALIRPASIHSRGYAAATMGRAPRILIGPAAILDMAPEESAGGFHSSIASCYWVVRLPARPAVENAARWPWAVQRGPRSSPTVKMLI